MANNNQYIQQTNRHHLESFKEARTIRNNGSVVQNAYFEEEENLLYSLE